MHGISSAAPSAARSPLLVSDSPTLRRRLEKLAEGRGFEPPRGLLGPYPISSRTPSTGLGHPSAYLRCTQRFILRASQVGVKFQPRCWAFSRYRPCAGAARAHQLLHSRTQMIRLRWLYLSTMDSDRQLPSVWSVRGSTPAIVSRLAHVCLRPCHDTPSRRAASSSLPASRRTSWARRTARGKNLSGSLYRRGKTGSRGSHFPFGPRGSMVSGRQITSWAVIS